MIRFNENQINDLLTLHSFARDLQTTFETTIDLIDFNVYFQRMFLTKISVDIPDYDIKTTIENQKNLVIMQRAEEVVYDFKNVLNARHKTFNIKYLISRDTINALSKKTKEDFLKHCNDKNEDYLKIELVKEILEVNDLKSGKTTYYEIERDKAINELFYILFDLYPSLKREELDI